MAMHFIVSLASANLVHVVERNCVAFSWWRLHTFDLWPGALLSCHLFECFEVFTRFPMSFPCFHTFFSSTCASSRYFYAHRAGPLGAFAPLVMFSVGFKIVTMYPSTGWKFKSSMKQIDEQHAIRRTRLGGLFSPFSNKIWIEVWCVFLDELHLLFSFPASCSQYVCCSPKDAGRSQLWRNETGIRYDGRWTSMKEKLGNLILIQNG